MRYLKQRATAVLTSIQSVRGQSSMLLTVSFSLTNSAAANHILAVYTSLQACMRYINTHTHHCTVLHP
jgi:hypothetical protein